ncbi:N-acetylmuramoyl-L-alanine amidase [Latilactobacillus graminis]|uniref:N-acetylmuramoyl-L-alanine amidase family protein n=2 Tax=Latilactobacillus graminis TaxID=60519 RepID=A0AA89I709_9LACO|nr:N-acetylmuramoyl-L-alanine amidase [Latilactobacillus graminis]KRM22277.1 N-acetylmuramoyl-L-alanine amidase family protein [Latilactobacillus graminis DSM 20719]QFP79546.1 SH3 domain-containing protein [Latilactobacillus graminis]
MQKPLHWFKHYPVVILLGLLVIVGLFATHALAAYQQITIKANVVNVRQGPGLSYDVMSQANKGETMNVIAQKNNWYQVRLSGDKIGWVASWLVNNTEVSATSNRVAKVTNSFANVRQSSTVDSQLLGRLNQGDAITVLYQQNGWSQIKYNSAVGWVRSDLINLSNQAPTTVQKTSDNQANSDTQNVAIKSVTTQLDNTKLRVGPNTAYQYTQTYPANTKLSYISKRGSWYQVKDTDGNSGYVASWVVTPSEKNEVVKTNATSLSEATIVLDAGHGGRDVGALSTQSKYEKNYTLATVEAVAKKLKAAGANVVLTRSNDTFVGLAPRPAVANQLKADAFISIHFDSSNEANEASGTTTYYYSKNKDIALAKAINNQTQALPLNNRGIEYGNYQVLRDNQRPSILLELGYINSDQDFKFISSPSYQTKVANAVYNGLTNYFK